MAAEAHGYISGAVDSVEPRASGAGPAAVVAYIRGERQHSKT